LILYLCHLYWCWSIFTCYTHWLVSFNWICRILQAI